MDTYKIAIFVGSLRRDSYNRKVANELIRLAPDSLNMEIVEIGNLQHYNQDLDGDNPPEEWVAFREKIRSAHGVLFVTPEYNRAVPGVLKNAIDVGSRPYGANSWAGKPGAVVSVTPGAVGAFGANHVLRQSMVFVNVLMMPQPEAYISHITELLNDDDTLVEDTEQFMRDFLNAYEQWVINHT